MKLTYLIYNSYSLSSSLVVHWRTTAFTNVHIAICTVCMVVVVVVVVLVAVFFAVVVVTVHVHGGFAAVIQPRIHLEECSLR